MPNFPNGFRAGQNLIYDKVVYLLLNDENDIKLSVWGIILLVLRWIVLEILISVKMDPCPNLSIRWEDIFELIWLWNAWLSIKKMNLELNGVKISISGNDLKQYWNLLFLAEFISLWGFNFVDFIVNWEWSDCVMMF